MPPKAKPTLPTPEKHTRCTKCRPNKNTFISVSSNPKGYKLCESCRTANTLRLRARADVALQSRDLNVPSTSDAAPLQKKPRLRMEADRSILSYESIDACMSALACQAASTAGHLHFMASFPTCVPVLYTQGRAYLKDVNARVTQASRWRFTEHDVETGRDRTTMRLRCCQAEAFVKPSKKLDDAEKTRDRIGMDRFDCHGSLKLILQAHTQQVVLEFEHERKHIAYEHVDMPQEAIELVESLADTSNPRCIPTAVREKFPKVSSAQVHRVWLDAVKHKWMRDSDPVVSATKLLEEMPDEAELLDMSGVPEGVVAFGWVVNGLLDKLKKHNYDIIEIAMDATCGSIIRLIRI